MKAISLTFLLLLFAGAAQSQVTISLQYADPAGNGTAVIGPDEIILEMRIEGPPGLTVFGAVDLIYDDSLVGLSQMVFVPGASPGTDNGMGTIEGILLNFVLPVAQPIPVAAFTFDTFDTGVADFALQEGNPPFVGLPVIFAGETVEIIEPQTCPSDSMPELTGQQFEVAAGVPDFWASIDVEDPNADTDGDGIPDSSDNCIDIFNPDQRDTDADGIGNVCDADFNNDCFVNFPDLGAMRLNFFQSGDLDTDLNGDGITNFLDLAIMKGLFFGVPGPSGIPNICDNPQRSGFMGWRNTSEAGFCEFGNVTGGSGEAACLQPPPQPFRGGPATVGTGPALCTTTPLHLGNAVDPILELNINFQPDDLGGVLKVVGGTSPPGIETVGGYDVLYETSAPLGAFMALPGERVVVELPSVDSYFVCIIQNGDAAYAEVDRCVSCALSCGGVPTHEAPSRVRDCGVPD